MREGNIFHFPRYERTISGAFERGGGNSRDREMRGNCIRPGVREDRVIADPWTSTSELVDGDSGYRGAFSFSSVLRLLGLVSFSALFPFDSGPLMLTTPPPPPDRIPSGLVTWNNARGHSRSPRQGMRAAIDRRQWPQTVRRYAVYAFRAAVEEFFELAREARSGKVLVC